MAKKVKREIKKFPQIKKDIKDFLIAEEGGIKKINVLKIGMSMAILGMMLDPGKAYAQHSSGKGDHSSEWDGSAAHDSCRDHSSAHTNHSQHGNGSCGTVSW